MAMNAQYPDQIIVNPDGTISGGLAGFRSASPGGTSTSSTVTPGANPNGVQPFTTQTGQTDWFSANAPQSSASTQAAAAPYQGLVSPFTGLSTADFQQSPGFQFAMQQAMNAVQHSAAARGTLLTGGTLKALQGYATGLANQDYQNAFTRALQTHQTQYNDLFNLAQLGASTTEQSYV